MRAAPAWSLASRHSEKLPEEKPGPGAYNVRESSPTGGYSIGTADRREGNKKTRDEPGPGAYIPLSSPLLSGHRYFLHSFGSGLRLPHAPSTLSPGPGSYTYQPASFGPKYPLFGRHFHTNDYGSGPGPGHYIVHEGVGNKPNWSFGKERKRQDKPNKRAPGPGEYEISTDISKGKSLSFGKEVRVSPGREKGPGPASYVLGNITERKPAFSMTARHRQKEEREDSPGPGAYSPISPSPGGIHISSSARSLHSVSIVPGPGAYNPTSTGANLAPAIKSGGRLPLYNDQGTPGPGAYSVDLKRNGEGILIKGRHGGLSERISDVPGPSHYSPQTTFRGSKESTPLWSFPTARKSHASLPSPAPGPGNYFLLPTASRPSWTFGTENRDTGSKLNTPGPGTYDIKPTVPMVPSYLLPF